jgi:hypothetical protein
MMKKNGLKMLGIGAVVLLMLISCIPTTLGYITNPLGDLIQVHTIEYDGFGFTFSRPSTQPVTPPIIPVIRFSEGAGFSYAVDYEQDGRPEIVVSDLVGNDNIAEILAIFTGPPSFRKPYWMLINQDGDNPLKQGDQYWNGLVEDNDPDGPDGRVDKAWIDTSPNNGKIDTYKIYDYTNGFITKYEDSDENGIYDIKSIQDKNENIITTTGDFTGEVGTVIESLPRLPPDYLLQLPPVTIKELFLFFHIIFDPDNPAPSPKP